MVIFTATHCLHGEETRAAFDEKVASLYHDLDGGFSPLAWFFPPWMPFPRCEEAIGRGEGGGGGGGGRNKGPVLARQTRGLCRSRGALCDTDFHASFAIFV